MHLRTDVFFFHIRKVQRMQLSKRPYFPSWLGHLSVVSGSCVGGVLVMFWYALVVPRSCFGGVSRSFFSVVFLSCGVLALLGWFGCLQFAIYKVAIFSICKQRNYAKSNIVSAQNSNRCLNMQLAIGKCSFMLWGLCNIHPACISNLVL